MDWEMDTQHALDSPLCASDLTLAEWELIRPLLPPPASTGRLPMPSLRTILDAILYVVRTGGGRRFLPRE